MERENSSSCFSVSAPFIFLLITFQQICCDAKHHPPCPSSSCANFTNITSPFRLKSYPNHCGNKKLELDCVQNETVLTFFSGKYHINNINYRTYTMSLRDAGVVDDETCSYIPRYYLTQDLNDLFYDFYFTLSSYSNIAYLNCTNAVRDDKRYVKVNMSHSCGLGRHVYAVWMNNMAYSKPMMMIADIKIGCSLIVATSTSKQLSCAELNDGLSYSEIHKGLDEGIELSWLRVICEEQCGGWQLCEVVNKSSGEVNCTKQICYWDYSGGESCGIFYQITAYIPGNVQYNGKNWSL